MKELNHVLAWLAEHERYEMDDCVHRFASRRGSKLLASDLAVLVAVLKGAQTEVAKNITDLTRLQRILGGAVDAP